MQSTGHITRRDALKKTILFSTALATAAWIRPAKALTAVTQFPQGGLHFLAVGDFGTGNATQRAVVKQMAQFSKTLDAPLTAVLALGDNFYGKLTPERFDPHFEKMYPVADFNCPFYAVLGNHDYGPKYDSNQGAAKAQMQLDYTRDNPTSRWKMPAKFYAMEFPSADAPLLKIIFLDGNFVEGALKPHEKIAQRRFLDTELQGGTKAPWQWMITHFPLFSQTTSRGNSTRMIKLWGDYLKANPFSLYVSGHDHNLQHLQVEGYHPEFIVSGAGGASLYNVGSDAKRGFANKILGFNHFHVAKNKITVQFIDVEGHCLHAFERDLNGKVTVLT